MSYARHNIQHLPTTTSLLKSYVWFSTINHSFSCLEILVFEQCIHEHLHPATAAFLWCHNGHLLQILNTKTNRPTCCVFFSDILCCFSQFMVHQSQAQRGQAQEGWWWYSTPRHPNYFSALFFFSFSNVPQCPPPSTPIPHQAHPVNHPQAWPASGSQSKFKLKQGQLLLQPLWAPVIFPNPWGLFLSAARSQKEPVAQCEGDRVGGERRKRAEKVAEEHTQDQKVQNPEEAFTTGRYLCLRLGLSSEWKLYKRTWTCLRWRCQDGGQRRGSQAGHHEWRGAEEEAEGETEEASGHRRKPPTGQVPFLLHTEKSLPQGLHQHCWVEVSFIALSNTHTVHNS